MKLLLAAAVIATVALPIAGQPIFEEVEGALDFHHFNGMSGRFYAPEVTGAGVALIDLDGDGRLDVYLVQGTMLGGDERLGSATFPPRHPLPLTDRVFLQRAGGNPATLRFEDATDRVRPPAGYGMGVATGDVDGDGRLDLYVTRFGSNSLLRSRGDGGFDDWTERSGVDDRRWSLAATFFDADRDGDLDLYVGNYLDFSIAKHKTCILESGLQDYCGPQSYTAEADRLFRNRGDGTFEDVSAESGIGAVRGASMGVVAADLDGNGWLDLYVGNDQQPNLLWLAQRDGTFLEDALLLGCAVNRDGRSEASMGIDAGDYDGDGDLDLFLTHLSRESNTLYANRGDGFQDSSLESGLALASWELTSFGTAWVDVDNDGNLDLPTVSGAVYIDLSSRQDDPYPLRQRNQLFRNLGDGHFAELAGQGEAFERAEVSRGLAVGDLDDDGDADLVVANNSGPARLLRNRVGAERSWIGLRVVAGEPPRDALGALVEVTVGGRRLLRRVHTDGGYASSHDPRVLVGLDDAARADGVVVTWVDGARERFGPLAARRYHLLRRGAGAAPP